MNTIVELKINGYAPIPQLTHLGLTSIWFFLLLRAKVRGHYRASPPPQHGINMIFLFEDSC